MRNPASLLLLFVLSGTGCSSASPPGTVSVGSDADGGPDGDGRDGGDGDGDRDGGDGDGGMREMIIDIGSPVARLVYEPDAHVVYAIDPINRDLIVVDLASQAIEREPLTYVPSDLCIDTAADRLFIVNVRSAFVSEYELSTRELVRHIDWPAPAYESADELELHYHVQCAGTRLYLADAEWKPGLWTIELGDTPVVTDHSERVQEIGSLVVSPNREDLYYWSQTGWSAGFAGSDVRHVDTEELVQVQATRLGAVEIPRDPLDSPLVYSAEANIVGIKNWLFRAADLSLLFAFGDGEVLLAVDVERGVLASDRGFYDLDTFEVIGTPHRFFTLLAFFDRDGRCYYVLTDAGTDAFLFILDP